MILHAVLLAPSRLSTATLVEMTSFRVDYARIALGQALKTGIAVTLIKTLVGLSTTVHTENISAVMQLNLFL